MRSEGTPTPVSLNVGDVLSLKEAARIAGCDDSTIRRWALQYGIGRQLAFNQTWRISGPAFRMILAADSAALEAFRERRYDDELVTPYLQSTIDNGAKPVSFINGDDMSLREAAAASGVSTSTIARWIVTNGIGVQPTRKSSWRVSGTALRMMLAADKEALEAFRAGDLDSDLVRPYLSSRPDDRRVA